MAKKIVYARVGMYLEVDEHIESMTYAEQRQEIKNAIGNVSANGETVIYNDDGEEIIEVCI